MRVNYNCKPLGSLAFLTGLGMIGLGGGERTMKRRLELKAARVRKGWTQLHLAIVMSVSQQTIAKWERGINAPSTLKQIRKLEDVLGVPMEDLFPDIFRIYEEGGATDGRTEGSSDGARGGGAASNQPLVSLRYEPAGGHPVFFDRSL